MTALSLLREETCRVARALETQGITATIGGGLGLLLRDEYLRQSATRTIRPYPGLRST